MDFMDDLKRFGTTEVKEFDKGDSPVAVFRTDASNDEDLILILEEDADSFITIIDVNLKLYKETSLSTQI